MKGLVDKLLKHSDVAAASVVVLVVLMLIVPLPAFLVDLMVSINIAGALAILIGTMYVPRALDMAAFPSLLLLTTRPYALLPTIRSRVLHFRFPAIATAVAAAGWTPWLEDYQAWLDRLATAGATDKAAIADRVFTLYGLVARFGAVLDAATTEEWKRQKEKLPPDLDDDEQVAIETGIANGLRSRLFAEIEHATRAFALPRLTAGDEPTRRSLTGAVDQLEKDVRLLRVNLNESAALEDFLLSSLRLWTRRA